VLWIRIRDAVLFVLFDPWIRGEKKSGSGMNIPDHISESLEIIFWVKNSLLIRIRYLFDPGAGMEKFGSGMWYKNLGYLMSPGSALLVEPTVKQ
jgi:hypothetical protein